MPHYTCLALSVGNREASAPQVRAATNALAPNMARHHRLGARNMQIREAVFDDADELMVLYDRMCEVLGEEDFLPGGDRGGFPPKKMVESAIIQHCQFVGTEGGKIVAAYIMDHECDAAYNRVSWSVDAASDEASILHALRVLPEYGGRGYAKQLVGHAIQTARARGQRALRLDCIEGNDVPQRMYRSFGFAYVATVSITYPDIGVPRDFLLYKLAL